MTGNIITSEAIKSNSQRALAELWVRLAAGRRFPAFTDLDASALSHDPKQLVVWSVEGKGPRQRFRALFQGHNISQTFNSDWAGKTMDEVVPMSLRRVSLDAAKQCARTGVAVYMIISTIDVTGQKVDCHRLLLPFGRDRVEQVLASLQLTVVNARKRILKDSGCRLTSCCRESSRRVREGVRSAEGATLARRRAAQSDLRAESASRAKA